MLTRKVEFIVVFGRWRAVVRVLEALSSYREEVPQHNGEVEEESRGGGRGKTRRRKGRGERVRAPPLSSDYKSEKVTLLGLEEGQQRRRTRTTAGKASSVEAEKVERRIGSLVSLAGNNGYERSSRGRGGKAFYSRFRRNSVLRKRRLARRGTNSLSPLSLSLSHSFPPCPSAAQRPT